MVVISCLLFIISSSFSLNCSTMTAFTDFLYLLAYLQIILSVLFVQLHQGPSQLDALLEALRDFLLDDQHVLVVFLDVLEAAALAVRLQQVRVRVRQRLRRRDLVLQLVDLGPQVRYYVLVLSDMHLHQLLVLSHLAFYVLRPKGQVRRCLYCVYLSIPCI